MAEFNIGNRKVGGNNPALVIAEVAQAHDGSVNFAHAFVDAAAAAGADAIKFQTHIAAAESSPAEQWRVQFSKQDATRFDYWKRMEFTKEQWRELKEHAEQKGLLFLSSPFSLEAIELLSEIGIRVWKIASGEVRNEVLLERLLQTKLPVLLSSGMSTWSELEATVARLKSAAIPFQLMQCTSAYPCPPERVGLNLLTEMKTRFGCDVGLSDHSGTIWPALAAVTLGAKTIEVHVTWDKTMFGPDTIASVTFAELKQMIDGIRFTEKMLAHPVDKEAEAAGMDRMRKMFGQSLVATANLTAGTVLRTEHIATRKPLAGIPASEFSSVLGAKVRRNITAGEFLQSADIEK
ncbi:MAG TPA: N-acetylneuraminate synthase family protein [Candidatus Kapabacteria bacterium]|nr:N-acetylneuraminate synthase family protein [Candidatus Kapabacteria bacterium]